MGLSDFATVLGFTTLITGGVLAVAKLYEVGTAKFPSEEKPTTPSEEKSSSEWDGVNYVSTWNENCGIAIYTSYLIEALEEVEPKQYLVTPVKQLTPATLPSSLLHVQHEYGIAPSDENMKDIEAPLRIATLHTVHKALGIYHTVWDGILDAYIVHTNTQHEFLKPMVKKPIFVIPHGSKIFRTTDKNVARRELGLPQDKTILYMHGFASLSGWGGKRYHEVIQAMSEIPNTMLVALASPIRFPILTAEANRYIEDCLREAKTLGLEDRVFFIREFISDDLINLYASASDIIVFNYSGSPVIASASGAVHRVLSAGKPLVCSKEDIRLLELQENIHALKFSAGNVEELRDRIIRLIEGEELAFLLGRNCRRYAYKTSWRNVALAHLDVYDQMWGKVIG